MVGANQYKKQHELQSWSIFFETNQWGEDGEEPLWNEDISIIIFTY